MPSGVPTRRHRFSFKCSDRACPLDAVLFQVNYWPLIGALFKKDKWRKDAKKKGSQPLGWAGNKGFLLGLTLSTIGYVCQIN